MNNDYLRPGDTVFANNDILNDGSYPDLGESALLVKQGTRGVIINNGYLEEDETTEVFLVQFENEKGNIEKGPTVGCWQADILALSEEH